MPNGQTNEALAEAVRTSEKHPSEIVRGITSERTLRRWLDGGMADPYKARQVAKRLGRSYGELFNGGDA